MALEIHFCPVLEGETAERFIYEAEHHVPHGPITEEEEEMLREVQRRSVEFRKKLRAETAADHV